jgi:hypothetical protein
VCMLSPANRTCKDYWIATIEGKLTRKLHASAGKVRQGISEFELPLGALPGGAPLKNKLSSDEIPIRYASTGGT